MNNNVEVPMEERYNRSNTPRLLARYADVGDNDYPRKVSDPEMLPPYAITNGMKNEGFDLQGDIPLQNRSSITPTTASYEEPDLEPEGCCMTKVGQIQNSISGFYAKNKAFIWRTVYLTLILLYIAYFLAAVIKDPQRATFLIIVTIIVGGFAFYEYIAPIFSENYPNVCSCKCSTRTKQILLILFGIILFVLICVVLFYWVDVANNPTNLISLFGIIVLILIFFLTSHSPAHVQWRTVISGLLIQFAIGVLILKTKPGFCFFELLGTQVQIFLEYSRAGVDFVFNIEPFRFATHILSILIFFSSFVAVLYHTGLMLYIIKKIAWVMGKVMGTTAGESLVAAANIFVGQSEAPLMIKPFLPIMTDSELHSVMTSGFATVAGTVMGAYISFGARASHLICASIMSAPAALAVTKLFYPETKRSKTTFKDVEKMEAKSPYGNVIEAVAMGAMDAISLAAGIAANLVAFISLVAFINACLTYFGSLVDVQTVLCEDLTLNLLFSYIFIPLVWIMGVEWNDCRQVSELVGVKTFVNEFVAYENLGKLTRTRGVVEKMLAASNLTTTVDGVNTMVRQLGCVNGMRPDVLNYGGYNFPTKFISSRSEIIATYALCGFANFGSIGIQLGALASLAPSKKSNLSRLVVRAMIAGNVACFLTACIAGLLYDPAFENAANNNCTLSWIN